MEPLEPRLYLGAFEHSSNIALLVSQKITHVISIGSAPDIENTSLDIKYDLLDIRDWAAHFIIEDFSTIFPKFDKILADESNRLLVHSSNGISRSPSFIIGYLMKKHQMKLKEAFAYVQERQCIKIAPNPGFLRQLVLFEKNKYCFDLIKEHDAVMSLALDNVEKAYNALEVKDIEYPKKVEKILVQLSMVSSPRNEKIQKRRNQLFENVVSVQNELSEKTVYVLPYESPLPDTDLLD